MNQKDQDTTLDTFPKLLHSHAKLRPDQDAIREKDLGIWQSWTWAEAEAEIRALACGLASLGLHRRATQRGRPVMSDDAKRALPVLGRDPVTLPMSRRQALKVMAIAAAAPSLTSCLPGDEEGVATVATSPTSHTGPAGTAWDPDLIGRAQ